MLRLIIQALPGPAREHLMEGDRLVFGRGHDCEVRLPGKFTSRRHAEIRQEGDQALLLEDLGSHNGTKLNGRLIEGPTEVVPGDVIHISTFAIAVDEVAMPDSFVASSISRASSSVSALHRV